MKKKTGESDEDFKARNRENQRRFREKNPGYYKKNIDANHPEGVTEWKRKYNIKRTYGLEWLDFLALIEKQGGTCAICKLPPSIDVLDRAWQIDHDHKTGKVRGLLCRHCNWALGHFNDDVNTLQAAINYLRG